LAVFFLGYSVFTPVRVSFVTPVYAWTDDQKWMPIAFVNHVDASAEFSSLLHPAPPRLYMWLPVPADSSTEGSNSA